MSEYRKKTFGQHIEETRRNLLESSLPTYEKRFLKSYERMGLKPNDTMYDVVIKSIKHMEKEIKDAGREIILAAFVRAALSPNSMDSYLWMYKPDRLTNELKKLKEWQLGFKEMLPDLVKEMNIKISIEEFHRFIDHSVGIAEKLVYEHMDMRMGKS